MPRPWQMHTTSWLEREIDRLQERNAALAARVRELEEALTDLATCFEGHTIEVREVRAWEGVDSIDGESYCTHSTAMVLRGAVRRHARDALDRARAMLPEGRA